MERRNAGLVAKRSLCPVIKVSALAVRAHSVSIRYETCLRNLGSGTKSA